VHWRAYDNAEGEGTIVTKAGGGYGDISEAFTHEISEAFSVFKDLGGNDEITTGSGDNVAIGGFGEDVIPGGSRRDILVSTCSLTCCAFCVSNFHPKIMQDHVAMLTLDRNSVGIRRLSLTTVPFDLLANANRLSDLHFLGKLCTCAYCKNRYQLVN
jgi:hypothetical protein